MYSKGGGKEKKEQKIVQVLALEMAAIQPQAKVFWQPSEPGRGEEWILLTASGEG